jgi:hypothetical protein
VTCSHTRAHQQTRRSQLQGQRLMQECDCRHRSHKRRRRKVGARTGGAEIPQRQDEKHETDPIAREPDQACERRRRCARKQPADRDGKDKIERAGDEAQSSWAASPSSTRTSLPDGSWRSAGRHCRGLPATGSWAKKPHSGAPKPSCSAAGSLMKCRLPRRRRGHPGRNHPLTGLHHRPADVAPFLGGTPALLGRWTSGC